MKFKVLFSYSSANNKLPSIVLIVITDIATRLAYFLKFNNLYSFNMKINALYYITCLCLLTHVTNLVEHNVWLLIKLKYFYYDYSIENVIFSILQCLSIYF